MLISSMLLLFAALLNYIFPNAVQLFIYVTTLSTVLYLFVWTLIIISYIIYAFKNKEEHKANDFKLRGGPYAGIVVLLFFLFAYVLLFFTEETRNALFVAPIWFIIVILFYQKYKHNAHANVQKMRETKNKHMKKPRLHRSWLSFLYPSHTYETNLGNSYFFNFNGIIARIQFF